MKRPDVLVVGAGHNGLVCAAYLARAGVPTLLLDGRPDVGGCAATVADLGARFNICNCDHTMVRAMPLIEELDLAAHGLRYLEQDPSFLHLFWDGSDPWMLFPQADRTIDGLARTRPAEAKAYRRYVAAARPVAELVVELSTIPPSAARLARGVLARRAKGAATLVRWSRASALEVLRSFFTDESLLMPLVSFGPTVWGLPPDTPGTGLAAMAYALRHVVTVGRPEGGSGALTDAIRRSFEAAGGVVRVEAPVERVLVERGQVRGVVLVGGEELLAGTVVAACDPRAVLVDWLTPPPSGARLVTRRWRDQPAPDGYESKVDAVVSAIPRYPILDRVADQLVGIEPLEPTAVISPTLAELAEAHRLRAEGRVAPRPTMLANLPSVLDPTLRVGPQRDHVLSLEVLFTPYRVAGGWPGSPEPRRWIDQWATLVEPGYTDHLSVWRAMTPDRYEAEFGMRHGHTPAYTGSPLATLVGRRRELSRYRTPVRGLYLTGAGTYPGAGIWGAAGANAAHAVMAHA